MADKTANGGVHDETAHADQTSSQRSGAARLGLFGASSLGQQCLRELRALQAARTIDVRLECFFDNDAAKWGTTVADLPVRQPTADALASLDIIWITSSYAAEIGQQIDALGAGHRAARTLADVLRRAAPASIPTATATRTTACSPTAPASTVATASTEATAPTATADAARRGTPDVAIVIADEGWILERCAREIESRLPYVRVSTAPIPGAKVTYYVNYSARRQRVSPVEAAFFTHVEERAPAAAARFFEAGRDVDVAIAMSARYAEALREQGARDVRVVTPGVDLDRFRPLVRIGVVGRTYHTGRKGEDLVRAVFDEPHIEWHFTGEGWPGPARRLRDDELLDFYRSMDYILVPAHYEGGPMPLLEALACGVEVIAPRVGFVDEYPHIEFETGNADDLRRVLRGLVETRLARRQSVEGRSWQAWAEAHDSIFRELLARVPAARAEDTPRAASASGVETEAGAEAGPARLRVLLAMHAPESVAPTGGPSIRIPRMREALRAHGVEADIATEELPDPTGYDLVHVFNVWDPAAARRQLTHLRTFDCPIVFSPILLDLEEGLWAQRTIVPLLRSGAPAATIDAELARLAETPIAMRRTLGAALSDAWLQWPATVRELVALTDHLIALSEYELSVLNRMGALTRPYSLVHNGVDSTFADSATGEAFAAHVGVRDYVLCVGRIEPRKNQLMLAHALRDTGIDLVLLGDTPKQDYADLVRAVGGPRVHLAGKLRHDDPLLASAYAGARVFVLPSWSEGAPLSALEAAAFGLPLVLSDRSGEREYFGPLATYCDPTRAEDIRVKVLDAWNAASADVREKQQTDARGWIARALTWDHAARETAQAYARTLAARPAASTTFTAPAPRKLEIGSGMTPHAGYEHLDARSDLPDIDHVADIRFALPFPDGTFDELMSRSCIEHVSWREVQSVMREWGRIIKPGGRLDIWTPDFEYLCRRYLARKDDHHLEPTLTAAAGTSLGGYDESAWAMIKMFGGQDYQENFHGAVLNEDLLARVLEGAGFEKVERHEPYSGLHLIARRAPIFAPRIAAPPSTTPEPRFDPAEPNLLWDGPLFNFGGYAALSRHVMRALVPGGFSVRFVPRDDDASMRAASLASRESWLWKRMLRRRGRIDVHVSCYTPTDWHGTSIFDQRRAERPGCRAYVGLSMFETDRLPAGWADACANLDEVWVPSTFARDRFAQAGVPERKLQVLPVGIDADRYDPRRVAPLPIPGRRGFMFLSVFDWTLRKGWDVLIEAYGRAFRAADDVCLVLRTASRSSAERPEAAIRAVFDRLGLPVDERPTVILLDTPLSEEDMPRLYRAADTFVLPTRGEGWGLPLMEAMASGLPTIATRWGGHLDFMDDANSWLIDVEGLVPVADEQARRSPFYAGGHRWAQPSVTHTSSLMRRAFDDQEQAHDMGRRARASIRASWSPHETTRWVSERLAQLAPDAAPMADTRLAEARAAEAEGRYDAALALYAEAAKRHGWYLPQYNRASLLRRLDRRDEAEALFQEIARYGEEALRTGALFHLGDLALAGGRLDDARRRFAECLALNPGHAGARASRAFVDGRLREEAGDIDGAERAYADAARLKSGWIVAIHHRASACRRLGRTEQAITLFASVARGATEAARRGDSHFQLAQLHDDAGRAADAAGHADSCLLELPDHQAARELREQLLARQA